MLRTDLKTEIVGYDFIEFADEYELQSYELKVRDKKKEEEEAEKAKKEEEAAKARDQHLNKNDVAGEEGDNQEVVTTTKPGYQTVPNPPNQA